MFICKNCKAIYTKAENELRLSSELYCDDGMHCATCKDNIIEIDDEICPILITLWDKGYTTLFSCSGHVRTPEGNPRIDLDMYIMIDADNFKDDFIERILDIDTRKLDNLACISLTTSEYNNLTQKCIRIGANLRNPEIEDMYEYVYGATGILPVPTGRICAPHYSLLCAIRKEIADMVSMMPTVTTHALIDPSKKNVEATKSSYDCKYDKWWVDVQLRRYPFARQDVLTFISAINEFENKPADSKEKKSGSPEFQSSIEKLFGTCFCYYFALMLQDAFGGSMVYCRTMDHIAWMDENGVIYSIYGVCEDYATNNYVRLSELEKYESDTIEMHRHRTLTDSK